MVPEVEAGVQPFHRGRVEAGGRTDDDVRKLEVVDFDLMRRKGRCTFPESDHRRVKMNEKTSQANRRRQISEDFEARKMLPNILFHVFNVKPGSVLNLFSSSFWLFKDFDCKLR